MLHFNILFYFFKDTAHVHPPQHHFNNNRVPSPSLLQPQLSSDALFTLSNQQAQAPRPHHTYLL